MRLRALSPAFCILLAAGSAAAQDTPPAVIAAGEQVPTQTRLPGQVDESPAATTSADDWWEFVGGYEAGTETGYGFAGPSWHHPIRDGLTEVDGPGINPAIGLRFGNRNWFRVMAGLEIRKHSETVGRLDEPADEIDETRVGADLGADAWLNPSDRSNVHAMVHYGSASDYLWGRLMAKHQVSNFSGQGSATLYLGGELIGQGNQDIRSTQVGALGEVLLNRVQLSLVLRGGYKKSTFDVGDDDTGGYFGVGVWKRF
jgi:hypothetical protein